MTRLVFAVTSQEVRSLLEHGQTDGLVLIVEQEERKSRLSILPAKAREIDLAGPAIIQTVDHD